MIVVVTGTATVMLEHAYSPVQLILINIAFEKHKHTPKVIVADTAE